MSRKINVLIKGVGTGVCRSKSARLSDSCSDRLCSFLTHSLLHKWRILNLDATYTERYMGNAQPQAYATGDVTRPDIEKFNTTRLLLMHGLQDGKLFDFRKKALIRNFRQCAFPKFRYFHRRITKAGHRF